MSARIGHQNTRMAVFSISGQPPVKAVARRVIELCAEPLPKELVDAHELIEAEAARRVGIDEDVNVRAGSRLVAGH